MLRPGVLAEAKGRRWAWSPARSKKTTGYNFTSFVFFVCLFDVSFDFFFCGWPCFQVFKQKL